MDVRIVGYRFPLNYFVDGESVGNFEFFFSRSHLPQYKMSSSMSDLQALKKIRLSNMEPITSQQSLDEKSLNLFSRQNAALGMLKNSSIASQLHTKRFVGAETTAKLIKMKVLIYGLRGVGVETAKNLALQGVGAITVSY